MQNHSDTYLPTSNRAKQLAKLVVIICLETLIDFATDLTEISCLDRTTYPTDCFESADFELDVRRFMLRFIVCASFYFCKTFWKCCVIYAHQTVFTPTNGKGMEQHIR